VLRRTSGSAPTPEILRAGALVLDVSGHQATLHDRDLDLTPTEFDLLSVLLQNPSRAFTRLELLDRVQGDAYEGYERTIDAHIKNLRAKLGDDPRHPRYIQTVFGVGYKLGPEP
jgi:two-component system, OmpR family, alkaline phosphatase synthesis response regulator PhoP